MLSTISETKPSVAIRKNSLSLRRYDIVTYNRERDGAVMIDVKKLFTKEGWVFKVGESCPDEEDFEGYGLVTQIVQDPQYLGYYIYCGGVEVAYIPSGSVATAE
jgi:hypothetical protein